MPALPTLSLLSLSADPKTGSQPLDAAGGDADAFQAALTRSLAQADADPDADPGEGPLSAFNVPVDVNTTAESLLEGTVSVDQVDAAISGVAALPLAPIDGGPVTTSDTSVLTAGTLAGGSQQPAGDAGIALGSGVDGAQTALSQLNALPLTSLQTPVEHATNAAETVALTQTPTRLVDMVRPLNVAARGEGTGLLVPGDAATSGGAALPVAVAAALATQEGKPPAPAGLQFETNLANQSASATQAIADQALAKAPLNAPVALQQLAAVSETTTALNSADAAAIDSASAVAYAPASAHSRELAGSAPMPMTLNRPLASPEWNNELGERIVWLAENNKQSAELQLNPRELGPLAIRISVADDVARITFTAQHAMTRDALEAAMPQLRDMLQSQGLSLGEANVSADSAPGQEQAEGEEEGAAQTAGTQSDPAAPTATTQSANLHNGLFDGYA